MRTITPKTTKKWFVGAIMAVSMAMAGSLLLPTQNVFASQSDIFWSDSYLWTDGDGYSRFTTKFQHDQFLCWGTLAGEWSYGRDYDTDYHLRAYLTSHGNNLALVPDLPSNIDWTWANNMPTGIGGGAGHCELYEQDQVVAFYIATGSRFLENDDGSIRSDFGSGDYVNLAFAGGTQGGNWYSEPNISWDSGSHPATPPEPTLSITYPIKNTTNVLNTTFTATGSYTVPDGDQDYLILNVTDSNGDLVGQMFSWISGNTTGTLSETDFSWYSGLGAGTYDVEIGFSSTLTGDLLFSEISSIQAVDDLVPRLPNQEIPPRTYTGTDPEIYYTNNSEYSTSTPLYTSLSGSIAPMIESIGQNLQFFSYKFPISNAHLLGSNLGSAIQDVNGYVTNINQLFGTLPIVQFLSFYLTVLILVSVFRITKSLINIVKR